MEITIDMVIKFVVQMYVRSERADSRLERIEDLLLERSMPKKIDSDLLNVQEASQILNLSVSTIYSKVCRKELPSFKRGKKLFFSRIELTAFVKEGRRLTNAEIGQNAVMKAATAMNGGAK